MNPLFSKSSLTILESFSFTKTLYAFDFDGTLSKIVRTPSAATISVKTNQLLKDLSSRVPVAIISGRGLADLKRRLVFIPPYLVGNHGLEGLPDGASGLDQAKDVCRTWKNALSKASFGAGVEIEDKIFSLAIHYRRSRQKKIAKAKIMSAFNQLDPAPKIIGGKSVVNLIPPGAPHKGAAVLELARRIGARHIFYIGDDDTDEDVFSLPDSNLLSVRVGQKATSQARYYIRSQSEINRVLQQLIRFHPVDKHP
ncbi:MAG: trehalose-phosphatase [Bacteriovoracia bacterium]